MGITNDHKMLWFSHGYRSRDGDGMSDFEYIKLEYKQPEQKTDFKHYCPDCNNGLEWSMIPCPEGLPGCLAAHYGWRCVGCGAVWQVKIVTK